METKKVLLVKTEYDKGFILDIPLEDAVKIIDSMIPVYMSNGRITGKRDTSYEFIIYNYPLAEEHKE